MNSQPIVNNFRQVNQKTNIHTLLETLKKKVKDFAVIDKQGQSVGKVKDLVLDANHRLNLVISKETNQSITQKTQETEDRYSLALLRSQKIKKIDNPTKSVFIDLEQSEIEYMPEYLGTQSPGDELIPSEKVTEKLANNATTNNSIELEKLEEIGEEEIIRLLEERLVVGSKKRKVGDVIVRKEIETRMIQVPVQREKLIVEQVTPEHKRLAEIDLGQGEISCIELTEGKSRRITNFDSGLTVSGEFNSPKIASLLLNAIALETNHGCQQVKVAVFVEDESLQKKYQEWFDRCSQGKSIV
jgi:stress response protein YsnF/sporulation protein YlmC with PRC-barrel domain